jgi:hypothetical protein
LYSERARAIENVPLVAIFAVMIGTHRQTFGEW